MTRWTSESKRWFTARSVCREYERKGHRCRPTLRRAELRALHHAFYALLDRRRQIASDFGVHFRDVPRGSDRHRDGHLPADRRILREQALVAAAKRRSHLADAASEIRNRSAARGARRR